jgi:hypothetical protein
MPRRRMPLLALIVALPFGASAVADASTAKVFKNCTAVHTKYKHGIAKSSYAASHATGLTGTPKVSRKLYKANKRLDRDRDGVACEQ